MNWILVAISAGMLMTSSHDTEEACLGRLAIITKAPINVSIQARCIDMRLTPIVGSVGIGSLVCITNNSCK